MTNCKDKAVMVTRHKRKYDLWLKNADGSRICNLLYCGKEKCKHEGYSLVVMAEDHLYILLPLKNFTPPRKKNIKKK
jgi:hypothetical protein